jgi:hypothetical protein
MTWDLLAAVVLIVLFAWVAIAFVQDGRPGGD